jgi:hypothetical protein
MVPMRVPEAWGWGRALDSMGEGGVLFEAGTVELVWTMVKPVPAGPDWWTGASLTSEEMMEVPSAVWEVVMRRGGGREAIMQNGMCAYSDVCLTRVKMSLLSLRSLRPYILAPWHFTSLIA